MGRPYDSVPRPRAAAAAPEGPTASRICNGSKTAYRATRAPARPKGDGPTAAVELLGPRAAASVRTTRCHTREPPPPRRRGQLLRESAMAPKLRTGRPALRRGRKGSCSPRALAAATRTRVISPISRDARSSLRDAHASPLVEHPRLPPCRAPHGLVAPRPSCSPRALASAQRAAP